MTREEISKILSLVKEAYPQFNNNQTEQSFALQVELWNAQFKNESYPNVYKAIMYYISTNAFPPTIAGIKKIIYEQIVGIDLPNNEEAWKLVLKAGRCNGENAREELNKLPEYIRSIITIETLIQIGYANRETLNYIKNDFLKNYEKVLESHQRESQISSISNNIKLLDGGKARTEETVQIEKDSNQLLLTSK